MEQGDIKFYRILVAIETDATRYHGTDAKRPGILERSDAEQLLAHIAADLKSLLPETANCSLIAAGAVYDQTQILRPGYPVFQALEDASIASDPYQFRPGLISIGAEGGNLPVDTLQPSATITLGLLQLLPIVIQGPAGLVGELGQAMEYRFLEEGQLSAHSAAWMAGAFDITINHARLMTLTDLNAMLRMQLDHFGFLPLWELLDAALAERTESLRVTTEHGHDLEWKEGAVHIAFETFDYWASGGSGADESAERQNLAGGYGDWTRELRQYFTTLKAHGLDICFHLAETGRLLQRTFFTENSATAPGPEDTAITEHSFGDLGTVAITVVNGDQVENYYPLSAQGLNDVHSHLRGKIASGQTIAFPGVILYDETTRRLIPDRGDGEAHH